MSVHLDESFDPEQTSRMQQGLSHMSRSVQPQLMPAPLLAHKARQRQVHRWQASAVLAVAAIALVTVGTVQLTDRNQQQGTIYANTPPASQTAQPERTTASTTSPSTTTSSSQARAGTSSPTSAVPTVPRSSSVSSPSTTVKSTTPARSPSIPAGFRLPHEGDPAWKVNTKPAYLSMGSPQGQPTVAVEAAPVQRSIITTTAKGWEEETIAVFDSPEKAMEKVAMFERLATSPTVVNVNGIMYKQHELPQPLPKNSYAITYSGDFPQTSWDFGMVIMRSEWNGPSPQAAGAKIVASDYYFAAQVGSTLVMVSGYGPWASTDHILPTPEARDYYQPRLQAMVSQLFQP